MDVYEGPRKAKYFGFMVLAGRKGVCLMEKSLQWEVNDHCSMFLHLLCPAIGGGWFFFPDGALDGRLFALSWS